MNTIYIDQNQATRNNVSYFDAGELSVRADKLLNSRIDGYDAEHTALLTKYGQQSILLTREEQDEPGWWTIQDENNLEPGESVAFTYNGKDRQGKVVQAPWATKTGSVVCRIECVGEEFPKTFTVDKMEFAQCSSI